MKGKQEGYVFCDARQQWVACVVCEKCGKCADKALESGR